MAKGEKVEKVKSELQSKVGLSCQGLEQKLCKNNTIFLFKWRTKS